MLNEQLVGFLIVFGSSLIAAVILFKGLNSSASWDSDTLNLPVIGAIKSVKMKGAIAGFLITLVIANYVYSGLRPVGDVVIEGNVQLEGLKNSIGISVDIRPPLINVESDGHFEFTVPEDHIPEYLVFEHDEFESVRVHLSNEKKEEGVLAETHMGHVRTGDRIRLAQPVVLGSTTREELNWD